jgi:hypothetical protein
LTKVAQLDELHLLVTLSELALGVLKIGEIYFMGYKKL